MSDKSKRKKGTLYKLYRTKYGRVILKLLTKPVVSKSVGLYMNSKLSKPKIKPFIKKNNINIAEYEERKYRSYNDFFTRKIRPEMRLIDLDPNHFISPCDCKLSAYTIQDGSVFFIKDSVYSIKDLLGGNEIYKEYSGGFCLIFRLTVDDYHRYCYIDDGSKSENTFIKGKLHTVQPIALEKYNIYKRNCREYTVLSTENFGNVVQIEVGAMMVGRIVNLHEEHTFKRGEEKGMFEFGGSTVVLLVKKDTVMIDKHIVENTNEGKETIVKFGQKIGRKYVGGN